jgi:large subunit ribosomal protein L6
MSRIGRSPITIPAGVKVDIKPGVGGNDGVINVDGSKGKLTVPLNHRLTTTIDDGVLTVARPTDHRDDRAMHGLTRTLINNAIIGVTEGYTRNLEIHGVGFRCSMKGQELELQVGFSHTVTIAPPPGVTIAAPEATKITVSGIDKHLVGQTAANIRAVRPPDSYHGKGVRYQGETVKLKAGKSAAR